MTYKINEKKQYFIIKFSSKINVNDMHKCYNEIKNRELIKRRKYLIFDFRNTKHIHYACVKYIILIREQLNNNNLQCKIICNNPYVFSILDFMGYPIREDALNTINQFIKSF